MMSWLPAVWLILLAAAILIAPGGAVGYALGVRGWAQVIIAPALSVTLIAVSAIVAAAIGVRWSLASFAVSVAVVAALGFALSFLIGRRFGAARLRLDGVQGRTFGAGFALWALFTGYTMVKLFPRPDLVIQSYDNVFHLNAIQYALDTGQASTFTIGSLTSGGAAPGVYPAAWHGYVALILGTARAVQPGTSIGSAVNAATLAVILLAWAAGCLMLVQALAGRRLGVTVLTVAAVAPLFAFPWAFLPEGGLYPNLLGNSLLPGVIALLFLLAGRSRPLLLSSGEDRPQVSGTHAGWLAAVVLVAAVPGITLAHPNSIFAGTVIAIAVGWGAWTRHDQGGPTVDPWPRTRWLALAGLVVASIALLVAWVAFAPARPNAPRAPSGLIDATWLLLQGAVSTAEVSAPALTVVTLIGVGYALTQRAFAALISGGFAAAVFILALGGPTSQASVLAGGLFYNDTKRIAAFVVVASLPLIVASASVLCTGVETAVSRLVGSAPVATWLRPLGVVVIAAAIALPLQLWSLNPAIKADSTRLVVLSDKSRRMSDHEFALISRMSQLVPAGQRVIANPASGGGYIYSLGRVPVVFPHTFVNDKGAMHQLRVAMFDRSQLDQTCAAMRQLNAFYYYHSTRNIIVPTFGPDYFPALDHPDMSMLDLVAADGPAGLYRFNACPN